MQKNFAFNNFMIHKNPSKLLNFSSSFFSSSQLRIFPSSQLLIFLTSHFINYFLYLNHEQKDY